MLLVLSAFRDIRVNCDVPEVFPQLILMLRTRLPSAINLRLEDLVNAIHSEDHRGWIACQVASQYDSAVQRPIYSL